MKLSSNSSPYLPDRKVHAEFCQQLFLSKMPRKRAAEFCWVFAQLLGRVLLQKNSLTGLPKSVEFLQSYSGEFFCRKNSQNGLPSSVESLQSYSGEFFCIKSLQESCRKNLSFIVRTSQQRTSVGIMQKII